MPVVSIVVPTCNAEKHVSRCVRSILLQQTQHNYAIIIVDDASTDGTPEILREIPLKTKKIKVIPQPKRIGSYACRNLGSRTAQGDIIVFTEPDCVHSQNWLQEVVSSIISRKASAVQGIIKSIGSGVWVELEKARISLYRGVNTKNFAIKKEIFDELGGFDESFLLSDDVSAGDVDFYHRMLKAGVSLHHEENAVVYHYWPNNPLEFLSKSRMYSLGRTQFLLKHNPRSVELMARRNLVRYLAGRVLGGALESFTKTRERIALPALLKVLFFHYYLIFYMLTNRFLSMYAKNQKLMKTDQMGFMQR